MRPWALLLHAGLYCNLLVLVSCGRTDMSGTPGERLVGAWEGDFSQALLAKPETIDKFGKNAKSAIEALAPTVTMEYKTDGTFTTTLRMGDRQQTATGSWRVVDSDENELKISTIGSKGRNRSEVSITFESDDTIRVTSSSAPGVVVLTRKE